jgi:hypothetical protein
MATTMEEQAPVALDALAVAPAQWLVVQFYLDRLTRLLRLDVADTPDLSSEEQQRLRTRAAIGAIETLTALGAGREASDLLRAARRQDGRAAAGPPRTLLAGNVVPEVERRSIS